MVMANKRGTQKLTDFEKKILNSVLERLKSDIVYQRWQSIGKRKKRSQDTVNLREIFLGIDNIKNKLRL
jgi:hypothetical protein